MGGTNAFPREDIGSYMLLLCYQWNNGSIPEDEQEIRMIAKMAPIESLHRLMKKFTVKVVGGYQNARLEEERAKMA